MWIYPDTLEVALDNMQVRMLRPNWSAPIIPTDDMVLGQGFVPLTQVAPIFDPLTQMATEITPQLVDGEWLQAWRIDLLPAAQAEAMQAAAAAAVQTDMDAYLAEVRDLRERLLNRIAGIATAALATSDQDTVDAFVTARQRLLDITKIPAALAATTRAELETAIKTEYVAIVQSVPASLIAAFDMVDQ